MSIYMQETLGISGLLLVKAFTKERTETRRFGELNSGLRQLKIRESMIGRWFQALLNVLMTLAPALILLLGGYLVLTCRPPSAPWVRVIPTLRARIAGYL